MRIVSISGKHIHNPNRHNRAAPQIRCLSANSDRGIVDSRQRIRGRWGPTQIPGDFQNILTPENRNLWDVYSYNFSQYRLFKFQFYHVPYEKFWINYSAYSSSRLHAYIVFVRFSERLYGEKKQFERILHKDGGDATIGQLFLNWCNFSKMFFQLFQWLEFEVDVLKEQCDYRSHDNAERGGSEEREQREETTDSSDRAGSYRMNTSIVPSLHEAIRNDRLEISLFSCLWTLYNIVRAHILFTFVSMITTAFDDIVFIFYQKFKRIIL